MSESKRAKAQPSFFHLDSGKYSVVGPELQIRDDSSTCQGERTSIKHRRAVGMQASISTAIRVEQISRNGRSLMSSEYIRVLKER